MTEGEESEQEVIDEYQERSSTRTKIVLSRFGYQAIPSVEELVLVVENFTVDTKFTVQSIPWNGGRVWTEIGRHKRSSPTF